ncbi:MAG: osmoprotectant transport system substrate-binding protein [Solirubrobacteraceae bacterium]|jgi:osmoprotectant transport system substrate-binding protein|nr:osmoprotectant transport system substrate-binding protein [Solirubrobacteraceae bacterium]
MTTRPRLRGLAALLAAALTLGVTACGSNDDSSSSSSGSTPAGTTAPAGTTTSTGSSLPGKGKPAVTMGDKNFTEQYILGELYKQALEAKGFTVNLKANIGSSEITDKALTSGKIDFYPEYTGVIAIELAKGDPKNPPKTADETYTAAKEFEAGRGFTTLDKTPFFDADGLAVKPAYADKYGLTTVGDLKKAGKFSYGAPPENKTRFQGVVGMKQVYGLTNLEFKPLAIGLQYNALDADKIDVAAVFTTDGQLASGKYKVLDDTEGIFGFQNVTPVVKDSVLKAQGPAFAETLNAVSAKLTNEAMQAMNAAVDLDKKKPADVAKAFLSANGLV